MTRMRAFTIFFAFVVGITWMLTCVAGLPEPKPGRIINPFRKGGKVAIREDDGTLKGDGLAYRLPRQITRRDLLKYEGFRRSRRSRGVSKIDFRKEV